MALTRITSDGITDGTITGTDLTTNVDLVDNQKLRLGTGNDLQIYHDGNSRIVNTTNYLTIKSDQFALQNQAGDHDYITVPTANQNVRLHYDNVVKFQTQSWGCEVTGQLHATGSVKVEDNAEIQIGTSADLKIYHDGSDSFIDDSGTGNLFIRSSQVQINKYTGENMIKAVADGAVELYHDNTKMFSTESRGAILQKADACTFIIGSTNAGSAQLFLDGDSNGDGNGGDYSGIRHNSAGHLEIFADNPSTNASIYFKTGNANNRALIDYDGHFYPYDNNTYDLGTSNYRWRNVYTNDLNLSNEGGANDVDGTYGSYTIQEGHHDLFLINKRTGKKYKFNLTEVS